jgi:hypothetical protein
MSCACEYCRGRASRIRPLSAATNSTGLAKTQPNAGWKLDVDNGPSRLRKLLATSSRGPGIIKRTRRIIFLSRLA